MATLTYYGVVSAPPNIVLFVTNANTISGIITGQNGATSSAINFTLVSDVTLGAQNATLSAVFPSPAWGVSESIANIQATFVVSNMFSPGQITQVANPIALTLTSPRSTTTTVSSTTSASTDTTTSTPSITSNSANITTSTPPITTLESAGNTTTSVTSSSSSSSSVAESSPRSNTGAVAGAAVGCFLAGLLIAGLIAFFLLRRRRSKSQLYTSDMKMMPQSLKPLERDVLVGSGATKAWEGQLPQPDSDKTIGGLASRTLDEIEMFVEEFFVARLTSPLGLEASQNLSFFGSPHLSRPLAELMQTTSTPLVLIKHCIAFYLLEKIDPSRDDTLSLLPREYIIPQSAHDSQRGESDAMNLLNHVDSPPDSRQAVSQLRVLMAYTRPDPDQDAQFLNRRNHAITQVIQQISHAFHPWARGDGNRRASVLTGVTVHVSELGIKLFSQPASFLWRWESHRSPAVNYGRSGNAGGFVMLPGLEKITDQKAELLSSPISLVNARYGS